MVLKIIPITLEREAPALGDFFAALFIQLMRIFLIGFDGVQIRRYLVLDLVEPGQSQRF